MFVVSYENHILQKIRESKNAKVGPLKLDPGGRKIWTDLIVSTTSKTFLSRLNNEHAWSNTEKLGGALN